MERYLGVVAETEVVSLLETPNMEDAQGKKAFLYQCMETFVRREVSRGAAN